MLRCGRAAGMLWCGRCVARLQPRLRQLSPPLSRAVPGQSLARPSNSRPVAARSATPPRSRPAIAWQVALDPEAGTLRHMAGVRLIVQFTADSREIADQAVAAAVERCKKAQQEPGCLQFEVFRSAL